MCDFDNMQTRDAQHIWHPFTQVKTTPRSIPIETAEGAVLYDTNGKSYLDLISSWWVNLHGHADPRIADAIARQAKKLEQVIFSGFTHRPAIELSERLTALLPGNLNRVFFSDDGSTAVEVALKLARQYHVNRGDKKRLRFLAFEGGYHGDTFGAMSVGQKSGFFKPFQPLMFQVTALPFPETWEDDVNAEHKERESLARLEAYLANHGDETAGLIIEPLIQGAGGFRMCRPSFLKEVAARLKETGVLLIFDEVMTGFGRTGDLFACLKAAVTPDLIALSKGLTGGFVPMAVTVCQEELFAAFADDSFDKAFAHGHSFTANPIACAASLASLNITKSKETAAAWHRIEASHKSFMKQVKKHPLAHRARVCGTIMALNVYGGKEGYTSEISSHLKTFFLERGLLIRPLGHVVYLLPPYCITDEQLKTAYKTIIAGLDFLENIL